MALDWRSDGADWPNRSLSRFVAGRGVRWHVQRGGSGRRILLLHGAGGATHSWRDLIPALTGEYDVLAPDLPGQGFSRGTPPRFTLPAMAEDVGHLLQSEDFAPDLIVGHSVGAAIALRMTLDGHAAPRRILSLNGALRPFPGMAAVIFPQMAKLLSLSPLTGLMVSRSVAAPGAVRNLISGTGSRIDARGLALYERLIREPAHVRGTLEMMARWDLAPLLRDLASVRAPVLLAVGQRDYAVPPNQARDVAGRLRDARIAAYPGLGHLMHEEEPNEFADLIARTVSETQRA